MDTPRPARVDAPLKDPEASLHTPICLKIWPDTALPEEEAAYYLLARDGLFLCRNHEFFRSCVPAPAWPSELARQHSFLKLNYPKLPRLLTERVVGFFDLIGEQLGSEAAVLLAWDWRNRSVELLVPEQCGVVSRSYYGRPYPLSLDYEIPPLPPGWALIGDIHSHVNMSAYASYTDKDDEVHRPGLHLVVGRLYQEPPDFHCEVTVDATRFRVKDLSLVMEGYERRRPSEVPREWIDKVRTRSWKSSDSHWSWGEEKNQPDGDRLLHRGDSGGDGKSLTVESEASQKAVDQVHAPSPSRMDTEEKAG